MVKLISRCALVGPFGSVAPGAAFKTDADNAARLVRRGQAVLPQPKKAPAKKDGDA